MSGWWTRGGRVLLAAALVGGCGSAEADGADGEEFVRVINVEVAEVVQQPFVEDIRLTAVATANRDVMIAAEESGEIREILADKGQRVREGQEIARIDDAVLSAQVEQASAQAELAQQTWERRRRLWEEEKVGSEIAYLEAKFAARQTAANLRALEERLERTTIRAPFSGVLDQRLIEIGSMVGPGQEVARLVDLDPVKVLGGVPERYAADVHRGAQAEIAFDVLPDRVMTGTVSYVGATVNPQNRTFPMEVVIPNVDGVIKPQMVANVSLARRKLEDAVVVPQDALVRVEDGYVVFVVTDRGEGEVAEVRKVGLGPSRRNEVVVEAGLEPGDRLIVVGQKSVADGDRVSVVNR